MFRDLNHLYIRYDLVFHCAFQNLILEASGTVLEVSWAVLEVSWAVLEAPWDILRGS